MKMKRMMLTIIMLTAMLSLVGCFNLEIKDDTDYPGKRFKEVQSVIAKLHKLYPDRKGPVSNLNFLVYIGEERKLISFSIPKTMMSSIVEMSKDNAKSKGNKYSGALEDFDIEKLTDLEKLGPGLLVEVEVSDKKEFVHLLIWLD